MGITIIPTEIPDVLIIEPNVYSDQRGFFYESFNLNEFQSLVNKDITFVQDNHSYSIKNTLRGLHYQINHPQGKLVRVIIGEVFDVAVDLRKSSKTYRKWVGKYLSAENKQQMWIPIGFAHGFLVLSDEAEVIYKATDFYDNESERSIIWNDPTINIDWPNKHSPILSIKDKSAPLFSDAEDFS